jgi:hypothetical protein
MQNKSKRRWIDIQIVIASIAVSLTVALWNVFAKGSPPVASAVSPQVPDPTNTFTYTPVPSATAVARVDPNAPVTLPKVHLLLGGSMPSAPVVYASAPSASDPTGGTSGGGGTTNPGGGGTKNPPPPPPTGSSKPK